MKRFTCLCAAVGFAAASFAAIDGAQVRKVLTEGVSVIDAGGGAIPGELTVYGENAAAIVVGRRNDASLPVVAAAEYGKGKVVAFGHGNFIMSAAPTFDTAKFLVNSIKWVGNGSTKAVALKRHFGMVNATMKSVSGITLRSVDSVADIEAGEVLVVPIDWLSVDEGKEITKFIANGGGVLASGLGWGWRQYNPEGDFATANAFNVALRPCGIACGLGMVHRNGGYKTADPVPAAATVDGAVALAMDSAAMKNANNQKQAGEILNVAMAAFPTDENPVLAALAKLELTADDIKVPSVASPLKANDIVSRVFLLKTIADWQRNPSKKCEANPAAAAYPGVVAADVPRLAGVVRDVDLRTPRWHSTGLFLPAGDPLTVKLPEKAVKYGLRIRIGTSTDDITQHAEWRRAPMVTMVMTLTNKVTTIYSPFGGLVYIEVPNNLHPSNCNTFGNMVGRHSAYSVAVPNEKIEEKIKVEFSGAVKSLWFKLGRDNVKDWKKMIAEAKSPWMELEGRNLVFTIPSETAVDIPDPEAICEYWDRLMDSYSDLAVIPRNRPSPERMCSDVQLSAGWLHNGYPMMFHYRGRGIDTPPLDLAELRSKGAWGYFHELGHNFQLSAFQWEGCGEVVCNIFTMWGIEQMTGRNARNETIQFSGMSRGEGLDRVQYWTQDHKRSFIQWQRDPFLALEFFMRLRDVYGWDVFKKLAETYHTGGVQSSEAWRRDQFALRLSKITGENIAMVMDAFNLPLSDDARKQCSAYPAPKAMKVFRAGMDDTWDAARAAADERAKNPNRKERVSLLKDGDSIVFLGDSITEISTMWHGYHRQWLEALKVAHPEWKIHSKPLGISGHTVNSWRSGNFPNSAKHSIRTPGGDMHEELNRHVDHVFILLGMNDILGPTVRDTPDGRKIWREMYRDLVRQVKERLTPRNIYLCDITPFTDDPDGAANRFRARLGEELDVLAKEENCRRVKTAASVFMTIAEARKRDPKYRVIRDFIHPYTLAGATSIARAFAAALNDTRLVDVLDAKIAMGVEALNPLMEDKGAPFNAHPKYPASWRVLPAGDQYGTIGNTYKPEVSVPAVEKELLSGRGFTGDAWKLNRPSEDYPIGIDPNTISPLQWAAGANKDAYYAARWVKSSRSRDIKVTVRSGGPFTGAPVQVWINGGEIGKSKSQPVTWNAKLKAGWNCLLVRSDNPSWSIRSINVALEPNEAGDSLSDLEYSIDPKK